MRKPSLLLSNTIFLSCFLQLTAQELPQEPPPSDPTAEATSNTDIKVSSDDSKQEGEALLRGPVHEAFAEPVQLNVEEGALIEKDPPKPVEEVPPALESPSDEMKWISGYWAWDDERNDFIWVSGVWRKVPPHRNWVPGEWIKTDNGWRWVAGYWMTNRVAESVVIPNPPPSLENGPTTGQPSDDHFWVPGCWQFQNARHVWRPGFWSPCHENWVWTPEHYVWRPDGCIHVAGFWDYHWDQRGTLFAPAYFANHHLIGHTRFRHHPRIAIGFGAVLDHLWVRPLHRHYYFGDYYGSNYARYGILPWHDYHRHHHHYDPLYVYHRWSNRHSVGNLYSHLQRQHRHFREHKDTRPQRTFRDFERHRGQNRRDLKNEVVLAKRVDNVMKVNNANAFRRRDRSNQNQVGSLGKSNRQNGRSQLPSNRGRTRNQTGKEGPNKGIVQRNQTSDAQNRVTRNQRSNSNRIRNGSGAARDRVRRLDTNSNSNSVVQNPRTTDRNGATRNRRQNQARNTVSRTTGGPSNTNSPVTQNGNLNRASQTELSQRRHSTARGRTNQPANQNNRTVTRNHQNTSQQTQANRNSVSNNRANTNSNNRANTNSNNRANTNSNQAHQIRTNRNQVTRSQTPPPSNGQSIKQQRINPRSYQSRSNLSRIQSSVRSATPRQTSPQRTVRSAAAQRSFKPPTRSIQPQRTNRASSFRPASSPRPNISRSAPAARRSISRSPAGRSSRPSPAQIKGGGRGGRGRR